jgi:hypothetical protein
MRLLTYVVATSSADSFTNTTPPEFANPTRILSQHPHLAEELRQFDGGVGVAETTDTASGSPSVAGLGSAESGRAFDVLGERSFFCGVQSNMGVVQ